MPLPTRATVLYVSVTTSSTQPSVAQIKAGQDHTGTGRPMRARRLSRLLVQGHSMASGLSPATQYYAHFVHTDAAENDSAAGLSSAGFTTYQLLVPVSTISIWLGSGDAGTLHGALGSGPAYARTATPGRRSPSRLPRLGTRRFYWLRSDVRDPWQRNEWDAGRTPGRSRCGAAFTYDPAPATDALLSEILSAGQADSISDHGPASAVHRDLNAAIRNQNRRVRIPNGHDRARHCHASRSGCHHPGYPEGISRTFRSARIRVSYRDTATAATSLTSPLIG